MGSAFCTFQLAGRLLVKGAFKGFISLHVCTIDMPPQQFHWPDRSVGHLLYLRFVYLFLPRPIAKEYVECGWTCFQSQFIIVCAVFRSFKHMDVSISLCCEAMGPSSAVSLLSSLRFV